MATLNISDLSVGDWVEYRDREWQVCSLYQFTGEVGLWRKDSQICENVADCEPIPLTPEILEKNGIHRTYEDDKYTIFRDDGLWAVKYSDGDWELSTPPVCRVDIKYVHQLQHVLRIAGIDKEINL